MGKLKVSFTTVLFVFSFIICVIVAVVFVDRGPKNDYDSFYESADEAPGDEKRGRNDDGWNRDGGRNQAAPAAASTSPAPAADDSTFADLPLDPHLRNAAQPVAMTATPAPTANPMQGRSPEEIARMYLSQSGMPPVASPGVPGMAVPEGIATPPAAQQSATAPPAPRQAQQYLPLQSNDPTNSMPGGAASPSGYPGVSGAGVSGLPSLGSSTSNANDEWSAVAARGTPDNMMGVRSAPANPQSGMMIRQGSAETGAEAPPGFTGSVTTHTPMPTMAPAGVDAPLLYAPQPGPGAEKWDLPPTPSPIPPLIQDPDRPRSEADPDGFNSESPDSMNPEGSSGQALAISEMAGVGTGEPGAEPAPEEEDFAARVNDRTLTAEKALKLVEVQFVLNDEILTEDKRDAEAKKAAEAWADVTAAAELARQNDISVPVPDVEKYAGMRPDFDAAAWQSAMAEKGFSTEEIRQQLMDIALSEKLVEMDFSNEVDDEEIRKAYDKAPSKFASPRKVHLQEIYKDKPDDETRALKVAASMQRLQRQAASGTDFGLLARQASQSGNRQKGGDLGWITPAESKDELRDKAIADLKPGQVSDVVEEPDGYRIYKLVGVQEATDDFDGGKDLVVAELKKDIRKESLASAREKLEKGEPLVKETIKTAKANPALAPEPKGDEETEASAEPETAEDAARKATAQKLLAEQAARRRAAKNPQAESLQQPQAIQQTGGPVTVTQQPGAANQLLYAPGTQVQQMAGGQPLPPYQAGGQTPAPPVFSAMTAPESVSVNDNVSVNYSPGQTMHIGGNASNDSNAGIAAGNGPGANNSLAANYNPRGSAAITAMNTTNPDAAAMTNMPAGIPPPQAPAAATPQVLQSNGWNVTKTVQPREERAASANITSGDPGQAPAQTMADAPAAMASSATIPPGFEGSSQPAAPSTEQPASEEEESRGGLLGKAKSLFGGFRR